MKLELPALLFLNFLGKSGEEVFLLRDWGFFRSLEEPPIIISISNTH
jgi:hypothetical protein